MKATLTTDQQAAVDTFDGFMSAKAAKPTSMLLEGGAGVGKCLGKGTLVLLFDGSVKAVEALAVGDRLTGPDSGPREILSVTTGRGPLFRIQPVKGEAWVCNDAHMLTLIHSGPKGRRGTGEVRDVALSALLAEAGSKRRYWKLFRVGVQFPHVEVPLDPHFLGLWFGDGTRVWADGGLHSVQVTKPDVEVLETCLVEARRWGLDVRTSTSGGTRCPTHRLVHAGSRGGRGGKRNPLLDKLRMLVLPGVCIPQAYVINDATTRLSFLAGFLDADGHLGQGCFEIIQKRIDYAEALVFLARGLGFAAYCTPKPVNGEMYYRVVISGDVARIPTRIKRKQARERRQPKSVRVTGFSVAPLGEGDYYGFTLDGDGRFLLGDFTVTHNTYCVGELLKRVSPAIRICATPTHKAMNVLRKKLDLYGIPWRTGYEVRLPDAYYRQVVITATVAQLLGYAPVVAEDQTEDKRHFGKKNRGVLEKMIEEDVELRLIVIDEVSMVSAPDFKKLEELARLLGARILAVGDAGQLPPVEEEPLDFGGFACTATLRQVVRQAEGSPIIEAAWAVREGRDWGEKVIPSAPGGATEGLVRVPNIKRAWLAAAEIQTHLPEEERRCFIAYTNKRVDDIQDATCMKLYGHGAKSFAPGEMVIARCALFKGRGVEQITLCSNGDELLVERFDVGLAHPVTGVPVLLRRLRVGAAADEGDGADDDVDDCECEGDSVCLQCQRRAEVETVSSSDNTEADSEPADAPPAPVPLLYLRAPPAPRQRRDPPGSFWASYLTEDALVDKKHPFNVEKRRRFQKARALQDQYKRLPRLSPLRGQLNEQREAAWDAAFEWAEQTVIAFSHPYALTSHKSQGSTFREAFVDVVDLCRFERRALYVAVTRPAKLLVVPSFEQPKFENAVDLATLAPPAQAPEGAPKEPAKPGWVFE